MESKRNQTWLSRVHYFNVQMEYKDFLVKLSWIIQIK